MKKKLLSFILVLAMILSLVPANIFAKTPTVQWAGSMNFGNGNNHVTDIIPNLTADKTQLKWMYPLNTTKLVGGASGAYYAGEPVIVDNYMYITGGGKLHKIDIQTGSGEALIDAGTINNSNDYLCIGNNTLYISAVEQSTKTIIKAFDLNDLNSSSSAKWVQDIEYKQYDTISFLNVGDGYLWCNGRLLSATNGAIIKIMMEDGANELPIADFNWSGGALLDGIYYVTDKRNIYAIDIAGAKVLNHVQYTNATINGTFNASGQVAYDSVSKRLYWGCKGEAKIFSISIDNKKVSEAALYSTGAGLVSVNAPIIYDGILYLMGQGSSGFASIFEISGNELILKKTLTNKDKIDNVSVSIVQSTPVLSTAEGMANVYFQEQNGNLCKLNYDKSTNTCQTEIIGATRNETNVGYPSAYNQIAFDDNGNLYCYNESGYLFCYGLAEIEIPSFTIDLSNSTVKAKKNDSMTISVSAGAITDGGTLSYQWLKFTNNAWENINGANDYAYNPDTNTIGITKYRCKVTNTKSEKSACIYSKWIEVEVKESLSSNTDLIIMNNGNNSNAKNGTHITYVESNGAFNLGEYYLKDYIWFGTADQFAIISNVTRNEGGISLSTKSSSNIYDNVTYTYGLYKSSVSNDDVCKYTITVTAEDGTTKDYIVNISFKKSAPTKQYAYVTIANAGELVKDKNGAYVAQKKVQLVDRNGDGETSVDELLYVAHEELYVSGASIGYESGYSEYGISLIKLWDRSGYFGYYLNDNPCDSLSDQVNKDDQLVAYIWKDTISWSDQYTYFNEDNINADVNSDIVLNLKACGFDANEHVMTSANVKVLGDNNTSIKPLITDKDGNVKLKFNKEGEYTVVAYIDSGLIVPAVCTINVTGTQSQDGPTPTQDSKVYFTLKGDTIHTGLHQGTSYPTWISKKSVNYTADMTVGDLFEKALQGTGVTYNSTELTNGYIASLTYNGTTLSEFTNGINSGWMYTVNGVHPNVGLNDYILSPDDNVVWMYVDDYQEIPESRYSDYSVESTKKDEKVSKTAITFTDVVKGSYYEEAVNWAIENKITNGVSETEFGPEQKTSRAQLVTFLWRLAGSPKAKVASKFSDVVSGSYYADAVAWAVEKGITDGIGNNLFDPEADVDRSQVVTFLWRYKNSPKAAGSKKFDDITDVNAWYYEAVGWASEQGITDGVGDNKFNPSGDAVRAQAVTFLYRLSKLK